MQSEPARELERDKRFPTVAYAYFVVLAIIVLPALAPLVSVLISTGIAEAAGCWLDEGGPHRCMIAGADWGKALNTMFVMGC